mmetsp:Transcript_512/g.3699  ORF Transcript_512/g.3699 Transcript_512/m.3699 type:complete len:237 (+) Transcript_512:251-961(+)
MQTSCAWTCRPSNTRERYGNRSGKGRRGNHVARRYTCATQAASEGRNALTLPTILTIARVAAIPVFAAAFYYPSQHAAATSAAVFIAASITDWLDGYLARKMNLVSKFGAFLDPVADKLMVATALVVLCSNPPLGTAKFVIPVPAAVIIGREITMSALREWAAASGGDAHSAVAVSSLGKWKTATQMIALTLLLVFRDYHVGCPAVQLGVGMLYASAMLALWSLVSYCIVFLKFIK